MCLWYCESVSVISRECLIIFENPHLCNFVPQIRSSANTCSSVHSVLLPATFWSTVCHMSCAMTQDIPDEIYPLVCIVPYYAQFALEWSPDSNPVLWHVSHLKLIMVSCGATVCGANYQMDVIKCFGHESSFVPAINDTWKLLCHCFKG